MKDILKKNHFNVKHLYITTLDVGRPYWVLYICTPVVRIDQRAHEHRGDDAAYQARPVHHLPQGSRQFKKKLGGGGGGNPSSFYFGIPKNFFYTLFSTYFFFSILTIFRLVKGEGPGEKHIFQLTFNPTGRMQTRTWRRANCAKPPVFSSLDISSRAVTRRGILSPTRWWGTGTPLASGTRRGLYVNTLIYTG